MTAAPPAARTAPPAGAAGRPGQADRAADDPAAAPGGARRGAGLPDHGHVHARFGGIPVLVTAEMAAQIRAFRRGSRDDRQVLAQ
jgi:hypothetical protein